MKYTSEQINSMSWLEWCETMAEELNSAGFKARGYNTTLGRWQDNYEPYRVADEPKLFILGTVDGSEEIDYLKSIGLLNNGRCPMCGNPINGKPGRFTSGYDHSMHFQICQNCVNRGKRGQQVMGINTSGGSGCIVGLLMLPYHIIECIGRLFV